MDKTEVNLENSTPAAVLLKNKEELPV